MGTVQKLGRIFKTPMFSIPPIPIVSRRKLAGALTAIAGFHRAGLSLSESFRTASQRRGAGNRLRWLLSRLADDLEKGIPLSTLTKKRRSAFPNPIPDIIESGERAGQLPRFIQKAADYLNRLVDCRNDRYVRTSYFKLLIGYCFFISTFISYAVFPTMEKIASSASMSVNSIFQMMYAIHLPITTFIVDYLNFGILLIAYLLFRKRRVGHSSSKFSFLRWHLELRDFFLLPGSRARRYEVLANCLEILGESLGAGMPFGQALRQSGDSSGSLWLSRICRRGAVAADAGGSPRNILRLSGYIPPDIAALLSSDGVTRSACLDSASFLQLRAEVIKVRIWRVQSLLLYLGIALVVGWHVALLNSFIIGLVGAL